MTRRQLIAALAALPSLGAQEYHGPASRNVKAVPRGKPSGLPFGAHLTDVAAKAGLTSPTIYGGVDSNAYILEAMGCGIAFLDYDNDGWLDIFMLSGTRLEGAPAGTTNRLYKNNRDGTFTDVTEKAGLIRTGWACGVTVADFDNDGFDDIFITYYGNNALYHNNGDGTFTDVTRQAGLLEAGTRWGSGCTFVDYDRDGNLDLLISHYCVFDFKSVPKAGQDRQCNYKEVLVNCGPRGLPKESLTLYHNNGDGTFSDVTKKSGLDRASRVYGLTCVAGDFDNDGWPDLFVACDTTPALYFRNRHDGTFSEEGLERGIALNEDGQEQAGMGVAVGDYRLSGSLDILKTHFAGDTSGLFKNDGKANFTDVTLASGFGVETRYVSWGAGFADLDNDGYPDAFIASGSVYPEVEKTFPDFPHRNPRLVFRNLSGKGFEELIAEAGPGVSALHCSRGCAFGDFDNDGDVDILVVNLNEPPSLLRNDVDPAANWIKVKLAGVKSNRSAIGARVTVRYGGKVQVQEVLAQSSYLSVNDRRLHFGLGKVASVDVEVRWPNGGVERFQGVDSNHLISIREGAGIVGRTAFTKR